MGPGGKWRSSDEMTGKTGDGRRTGSCDGLCVLVVRLLEVCFELF